MDLLSSKRIIIYLSISVYFAFTNDLPTIPYLLRKTYKFVFFLSLCVKFLIPILKKTMIHVFYYPLLYLFLLYLINVYYNYLSA